MTGFSNKQFYDASRKFLMAVQNHINEEGTGDAGTYSFYPEGVELCEIIWAYEGSDKPLSER